MTFARPISMLAGRDRERTVTAESRHRENRLHISRISSTDCIYALGSVIREKRLYLQVSRKHLPY